MKKKIVIAIFLVLLGLFLFNLNKEENEENNEISVIDENDIEEVVDDWSSYSTYDIQLTDTYTITNSGVYNVTGTITDGSLIINTSGNVKLILNGVSITNSNGPAIYVEDAKNVYIYLKENTTNIITDGGSSENDGAIFSTCDLFIEGLGILEVTANNQDGIVSKDDLRIISGNIKITSVDDGIRGKDSVVINNGNIEIESGGDGIKTTNEEDTTKGYIKIDDGNIKITSELDGIQAVTILEVNGGSFNIKTGDGSSIKSTYNGWGMQNNVLESMKGLKSGSSIIISGATIDLNTEDDAIHSNGDVLIESGNISISSGDDGIHADDTLTINDVTIDIKESYEGLEAQQININNGNIKIIASDDGINVAGGNDSSSMGGRPGQNPMSGDSDAILTINGGTIYVDSTGDGLDSNGSIYMNDGYVTVDGPTNDGNGALDYEYEFVINGGTLIAVGSSGMAEGLSSSSTQNSALINLSSTKTGTIKIGNITYTPSKSYSSIVISDASLEQSNTYDVIINDVTVTSFTQSSRSVRIGSTSGMGGPMRR